MREEEVFSVSTNIYSRNRRSLHNALIDEGLMLEKGHPLGCDTDRIGN